MRRNSTLAIWLALIMLLLVSAAAVFFLVQRNTQLEADTQQANQSVEAVSAASAATRDQLQSDIAVRQAALADAAATRDTLAAAAELSATRNQELESTLAQQQGNLAEAQATLQSLALQITIIAPTDGATVTPLEQLDIMAVASASVALNVVTLTVDGQQIAALPADGQNTLNVRAAWTPPDEGTYVIGAEAFTSDGLSRSSEVTVEAAFTSDTARQSALQNQLEEAVVAQRFPAAEAPEEANLATEAAVAVDEGALLHRRLLTGRDADDEQVIADEVFTLQALELLISEAGYRAYINSVVNANLRAYYDPDTGTLTVYEPVVQEGAFGRWLEAHDLAHDLQNERLGLNELNLAVMDGDQLLATRALAEGDAVFLQYQLLADALLSDEEADEVRAGLAGVATNATAALPIPLRETFAFAYTQGVPFLQALYDQGGFALVNGAWRERPVSSEQILHPERYLAQDAPAAVNLALLSGDLGQGWRLVDEDTFGEFLLRQHLARQPLADAQIDAAASGWGGGRYAVYQNVDASGEGVELPVVVIRLAWDSADDADEFEVVYADYLGRRFGGDESSADGGGRCWQAGADGVGCLFRVGADSLVVRAPSLDLALIAAEPQINMSQP